MSGLAVVIVPEITSAAVKAIIPACAVLFIVTAARFRRLSLPDVLGFRPAKWSATFLWAGAAAGWMLASNAFLGWRGPWDFAPWREAPILASVLRVLAVGILGPIAEELLFRGLFYGRLVGSRLGPGGAIVILALVWALIHIAYTAPVIAVIFVEGLLLGAARWKTGSIIPPILMHIIWNLYAVW